MSTNTIYNLAYLMEISGNDEDFVKQMLETFLVDVPGMVSDMRVYLENNDLNSLRETAHKLLTPLAYVGARKIMEKDITEIENRAIENRAIEGIGILIDSVDRSCKELINALKTDYKI